jgi:WD40 repeat protein/serine/threonine protein kinase
MTSESCPPPDRLRLVLGNELPPVEQAELVAHLDGCTACQQRLEELAGKTALADVGPISLHSAFTEELPLQRVLSVLKGDSGATILRPANQKTEHFESLFRVVPSLETPGQLDCYEVLEVLGQGGMGIVLKARDPALNRPVAIKVLAPHLASDPLARKRFAREAQAAAAVRHENVVTIHAVSEANGIPFLVMEYLPGGSLQDYLRRHGKVDARIIARLGMQLANGLAAAHSQGLIHRDIKPSNVLLAGSEQRAAGSEAVAAHDSNGQLPAAHCLLPSVKIADFGLARAVNDSHMTQSGIVAGTPLYMAPEQALGEALDARADLFSLGTVLYWLCTGKEAFAAATPMAVLRQVCDATPQPIREVNPAVPDWIAAIIERLHAKRPDDRFASAAEVAELFRQHLANWNDPKLVSQSLRLRRLRSKRRRWWLAGAVLLLLVGGLAVAEGLGWTHWTPWHAAAQVALPLKGTLEGHVGPILTVAFAPDGKTLATGSADNTVRLWNPRTSKQEAILRDHKGAVYAVAFAHSGEWLASAGDDQTIRLCTIATQQERAVHPHEGGIRRLAVAPGDRILTIGCTDGHVELWDLPDGKLRKLLQGHQTGISALAISPDGKTLASGDSGGVIKLWDLTREAELRSLIGDQLAIRELAFSPDGQTLASAGTGDKEIKLWNVPSGDKRSALPVQKGTVLSIAFAPRQPLLAAAGRGGLIRVFDLRSGRELAGFTAHKGNVTSARFSPDGDTLVSVGEDRVGKLWDVSGLAGRE